ncbi:hypothetical protein C8D99_10621 [Aminivibrio pyruvatiphilus]|uniref:Uncharacterized protein n=1 Tax=Aminivibrio pyruvatiphilus TaxID=1005740 RepID=A0A4R8MAL9_9BACT|nr:hypothetical protein C8D99_10621 [Aminivibrio pyruvatiphilus]
MTGSIRNGFCALFTMMMCGNGGSPPGRVGG